MSECVGMCRSVVGIVSCVWIVTIPKSDEKLRNHVDFPRRLFHPTIFAPERYDVLLGGLPQSLIVDIPNGFKYLAHVVSVIRESFHLRYETAEAVPYTIHKKAFDGLWRDLHS